METQIATSFLSKSSEEVSKKLPSLKTTVFSAISVTHYPLPTPTPILLFTTTAVVSKDMVHIINCEVLQYYIDGRHSLTSLTVSNRRLPDAQDVIVQEPVLLVDSTRKATISDEEKYVAYLFLLV